MSLTANTNAWSFALGTESRRWHLKEKLFLKASQCVQIQRKVRSVTTRLFLQHIWHTIRHKHCWAKIFLLDGYPAFHTTHGEATVH